MIAFVEGMMIAERQEADASFETVVLRETRRLFALALSILGDPGEAEDAVQETLVKAWRSWSSLQDADHPERWLARVCVNTSISRRRGLARRGWFHSREVPPSTPAPWRDDHPMLDVDRAYARLSVRQRAALTLNYRYGYSVDECAGLMGCRPGTVRAHVARALASLRKELGDA